MATIGAARERRRPRGWKRKLTAFLHTPLGDSLLKALVGGIILQLAILTFQSAARQRELIITANQERAKLRSQLRVEFFRERDRNSRAAFRVMGVFVTASENVMNVEEKAWRDLDYDPADQKAVVDFENQQRAGYNDAVDEWDRSEGMFDGLFAALDKNDHVPLAWRTARQSVNDLEDCIHRNFVASPPKTAPVRHPCRPAAASARQAIVGFGEALNVSKLRLINE